MATLLIPNSFKFQDEVCDVNAFESVISFSSSQSNSTASVSASSSSAKYSAIPMRQALSSTVTASSSSAVVKALIGLKRAREESDDRETVKRVYCDVDQEEAADILADVFSDDILSNLDDFCIEAEVTELPIPESRITESYDNLRDILSQSDRTFFDTVAIMHKESLSRLFTSL